MVLIRIDLDFNLKSVEVDVQVRYVVMEVDGQGSISFFVNIYAPNCSPFGLMVFWPMVFLAQEKMSSTSITADDKQNASEILGIAASVRKVNQIKAYR